jgi:hypothetical protein
MTDQKPEPAGIAGLPKLWAVAVQLIGTFGLAVFLVLYYVLVLQPAEAARYDKLATSVNDMLAVMRARQALLSRKQVDQLEELYIQAAAPEVATVLLDARARGRGEGDLARELDNVLMLRVDLLEGLTREDGGVVSSQLQNKLRGQELPQRLAALGGGEWRELPREEVALQAMNALRFAIRAAARAK